MSNGRYRSYYWTIKTLLAEHDDIVVAEDPRFEFSEPEEAESLSSVRGRIPFRDGSILHFGCNLQEGQTVSETRYAYIYHDSNGKRIFQYDDNEHHPEIPTSPHHMHKGPKPKRKGEDRAWPLDIEFVNFEMVLHRIRERFFS